MRQDGIGVETGIAAGQGETNFNVGDDAAAGAAAHLTAMANALDGNFRALAAVCLGIDRDACDVLAEGGVVRPITGLALGDVVEHFQILKFQREQVAGLFGDPRGEDPVVERECVCVLGHRHGIVGGEDSAGEEYGDGKQSGFHEIKF